MLISSDGGLAGAHPRGYGAFPRVLGVYAREKGVISLPVAVQKMTSATANLLGLDDRGTIAAGAHPTARASRATQPDGSGKMAWVPKVSATHSLLHRAGTLRSPGHQASMRKDHMASRLRITR